MHKKIIYFPSSGELRSLVLNKFIMLHMPYAQVTKKKL
jgi:hypothetical protein